MKCFLLLFFCSFFFVSVIGRRALLEEDGLETWKSVLGDVAMPKSLVNTLQPGRQVDGEGKITKAKDVLKSTSDDLASYFFTNKELYTGNKLNLNLKSTNHAKFLPQNVAKSMPFSSKKLPQILNLFAIDPKSSEAKVVKQTIEECEEPGIKSEDKFCAASLKSAIDYSVSKVGTRVNIHTTDVADAKKQAYTIEGVKSIGDKSVVCHKQKYVYAVFLCHEVHAKAYEVSLAGADGTKANAIAVCHADKESLAAMNVMPGSDPLCHFLPSDDLVWMPN